MLKEREIIKGIETTLRNEERTSKRITRALTALETNCYPIAKQAAELALKDAEIIEQRLALQAILMICNQQDDVLTKEFLASTYDI